MKRNALIILIYGLVLLPFTMNADAYTAIISGDWSNSLTWGGNPPPNMITGEDVVVINAGVVVNMDVDVTFDHQLSTCDVLGTLESSSNILTVAAEVNNFNMDKCYLSHFDNGEWDVSTAASAIVEGQGYFSIGRSNISSLSPFRVEDQVTTGIEEKIVLQAQVYPNPVSSQLVIDVPFNSGGALVRIFNAKGQKVKESIIRSNRSVIDVSDVAEGHFLLLINDQQAIKFIKQ